jgi:hypothetical protein
MTTTVDKIARKSLGDLAGNLQHSLDTVAQNFAVCWRRTGEIRVSGGPGAPHITITLKDNDTLDVHALNLDPRAAGFAFKLSRHDPELVSKIVDVATRRRLAWDVAINRTLERR